MSSMSSKKENKSFFEDAWEQFLLTLRMVFLILIFLSIFIPQSVEYWIPM